MGRSLRDFNGDGYSDLAVGAYFEESVYVYLSNGGVPDTAPDAILAGEMPGDTFGATVSAAGDVNGDGYSDLLVAAPLSDAVGPEAGRAYLYMGGSGAVFDGMVDAVINPGPNDEWFGSRMAGVQDVNGDGFDDVVIGAPSTDVNGMDSGRAYIYFGSSSGLSATPAGTLSPAAAGDFFGQGACGAGDVNGDGYPDSLVGAPGNDAMGSAAGQAYLYLGGAGSAFDIVADAVLDGEAIGDSFGNACASGDLNADGYSDVLVGASANDAGGANAGRVYLYLGGQAVDDVADFVLTGENAGDGFGSSLLVLPDLNGDGFADFVVAAPLSAQLGLFTGSAYVFFGGTALDTIPEAVLLPPLSTAFFGAASGGDYDADGFSDVVVAAPYGVTAAGEVHLFLGGAGAFFDDSVDLVFSSGVVGGNFGWSIASLARPESCGRSWLGRCMGHRRLVPQVLLGVAAGLHSLPL